MPVPYPAEMPTSGVTSINWNNATASLVSRSPFTFQGQAQYYSGAIRMATVAIDNLNREEAEDWVGFLDSLHGTRGTFLFGDPMAANGPMGVGGGSPLLRAQESNGTDTLAIKTNYTAVTNGYLRRGDWIQIGTQANSRLYKVTRTMNLNASGEGTIHIWPALRGDKALDTAIYLIGPRGLFRRSSGSFGYVEDNQCSYSISFDCEEVI